MQGLGHQPVNEMGVVFLFGMIAHLLGFVVEALQMSFPDCLAKLEVEPGIWQHVRIEFEFESRKFREHRHDPAQCEKPPVAAGPVYSHLATVALL